MAATVKLVALMPIRTGGDPVAPGAAFEVNEAQAKQLVENCAAETPQAAKARADAAKEAAKG